MHNDSDRPEFLIGLLSRLRYLTVVLCASSYAHVQHYYPGLQRWSLH